MFSRAEKGGKQVRVGRVVEGKEGIVCDGRPWRVEGMVVRKKKKKKEEKKKEKRKEKERSKGDG